MKLAAKIAGTSIFLIMLVVIPFVSAGVPKKMQDLPWDENLCIPFFIPDMNELDSSADIYFKWGYGITVEERETNTFPANPYGSKLFINGEEIKLKRYAVYRNDLDLDPPVLWMWYKIFGPDYFTAGEEYEIRIECWCIKPFEGDSTFGWHVFDVIEFTVYFY